MEDRLKGLIRDIVGPEGTSDSLADRLAASFDASNNQALPGAVAWPTDAAQVAALLRLANSEKLAVVPRGAGTGLVGSVIPVRTGLVLDLSRMNRILEIRIEDRLARVQPGVIYSQLDAALAADGFFFPPDPASGPACTLGGNVATNAGGIRGAKYGVTRDYLLGLEVVLPLGRVINTGSQTMKSVSGIPLTGLFCGSEGALGVITEITLKINPRPRAKTTALALFNTLDQAGRAIGGITRAGIIPAVLELLDGPTIELLIDHGGFDLPRVQALLLAETEGFTPAGAGARMDEVVRVFKNSGAVSVSLAGDEAEAAGLWRARRSIGPVSIKRWPNGLVEDVTVPMSRIPELLAGVADIGREIGIDIINFGHAGDGNLHPQIMFDAADPRAAARAGKAAGQIFELCCRLGGTLSGEHGIGLDKAGYMHLEHGADEMKLMWDIKRLLDPNNILNPGKMGLGPDKS